MIEGYRDPNLKILGSEDKIFSSEGFPRPFAFNRDVANVFDDMVIRSVPLYAEAIETLIYWVAKHYKVGTKIYDLGCSTATTMEALLRALPNKLEIVGVDNSMPMIEKAQEKLANYDNRSYTFLCDDIQNVALETCSVAIMNYTLQFIPVSLRGKVLADIADALQPGGFLFLSEKVRSSDPLVQETVTAIYEDFKLKQGYSRDEISRKKEALDNVLVPLTEMEQTQLLIDSGFSHVEIVLKWNNFTTFVAVKK